MRSIITTKLLWSCENADDGGTVPLQLLPLLLVALCLMGNREWVGGVGKGAGGGGGGELVVCVCVCESGLG